MMILLVFDMNCVNEFIAAILASFIMYKPPQRSSFTKGVLETMEGINKLDHFIMKRGI